MDKTPPWEETLLGRHVAVLLVRHGQTSYNAQRRFLGTTDIELDAVGHNQARDFAKGVPGFDRVFCSPLARALQTAQYLDPAPVELEGLKELRQGELEGMFVADAVARYPDFFSKWLLDPATTAVPGGESLGQCRDRAMTSLDLVAQRAIPGELIAVVTHQMVIATITCTILDVPLSRWRNFGVKNVKSTVLEWDEQKWFVKAKNWSPL
jgi:broad specificity phosphatase PhoE